MENPEALAEHILGVFEANLLVGGITAHREETDMGAERGDTAGDCPDVEIIALIMFKAFLLWYKGGNAAIVYFILHSISRIIVLMYTEQIE
jgi:hypothetical protein